tara:strand:+ start:18 stop:605 length:588 start_codon:yes stop_codon:yes gene_type:complete
VGFLVMIYIKDNFLDKELFDFVNKDLKQFKEVQTPGKKFWVIEPSEAFIDYITQRISLIESVRVENVLAFFREAKKGQDNDWRIHNDSVIEGTQPDRAIVFYMSENKTKELNGTAFWKHKKYGDSFKDSFNLEEFNRLIKEESNDLDKWELSSVVGHKKNRLLSYPCDYFHSKYPKEFEESRVVFVMFYKTSSYE